MARPRKINSWFWVWFHKKMMGRSISWIARRYRVSNRTIWRYLSGRRNKIKRTSE